MDYPKPLTNHKELFSMSFLKKNVALKIIFSALLSLNLTISNAQCFQIESILVDACDPLNIEGANEMVRFKVGSTNLNVNNLSVTWPNNSFLGICKNATTASKVATLNNSIVGCGLLKEPTSNILPAGAKVILITSTDFNVAANSFANLNDTIYVIFQCSGNTQGHFTNYGTTGGLIKTLTMTFSSPASCSDAVSYDKTLLIDQTGGSSAEDGATVNFTTNGTATYINNGCQAAIEIKTVNINQSGFTICPGDTINLSATVVGNFSSTTWTGGNGSFSSIHGLTTSYYSNSTDNVNFYIYFEGQTTCGLVKDSVLVQMGNNSSSVSITSPSTVLCSGDSILLTANGTGNYLWNTGSTANSIYVNIADTYSVTSTSACGSSSANILITMIPQINVVITEPDTVSICPGSSTTLHATGSAPFSWNTSETTNSIVTSTAGLYYVSVSNSCFTVYDSVQVITTPLLSVSIIEPNTTICQGDSITLHVNGASSYLWNNGEITNSITVDTSGTYSVSATGTCPSNTASVTINVMPQISINIIEGNTVTLCAGNTLVLHATTGLANYVWNTTGTNDSITISTAGTYSVSASNGVCPTVSDTITVTGEILPSALISGDSNLCIGSSLLLNATGTGSFSWSTGSTGTSTIITSAQQVILTSSSCNSSVSDTIIITEKDCSILTDILIPNVFTPNKDNSNDKFIIIGTNIKTISGSIYNRWGKLLFEWNDINVGWDGTFNGKVVPEGSYFYIVNATFTTDKSERYTGVVLLLK